MAIGVGIGLNLEEQGTRRTSFEQPVEALTELIHIADSLIAVKRSWRLNERHYGALQGKNKEEVRKEVGDEQFMLWRRSYATPPDPIEPGSPFNQEGDPKYGFVPRTESLKDVLERLEPYWYGEIVPELVKEKLVMVCAHGNSLRALIKKLNHLSPEEVQKLNLPTARPILFELDRDLEVVSEKDLEL